jgi:tail lysozyme
VSSVGEQVFDYFTGQGLTPAQAAGIVGNLQQESGLDPSASGGYLAQWLGGRLAGLERLARARRVPVTSPQLQAEYIWQELNTTESSALVALRKTTTPAAAAAAFSSLFERPGIPMLSRREQYAQDAYDAYAGTGASAGSSSSASPAAATSSGGMGEWLAGLTEKAVLNVAFVVAGGLLIFYGTKLMLQPVGARS